MKHTPASRYLDLAAAWLSRLPLQEGIPERVLVLDADARPQMLGLLKDGKLVDEYPVSTSLKGLGQVNGSMKTPGGWHRLQELIGNGCEFGTCFKGKVALDDFWDGKSTQLDLMLTRVLVLEGLEPGVNRGGDVDTFARNIYIHGTNRSGELGEPASSGGIRMDFEAVADLCDQVLEGDILLIAGGVDGAGG